MGLKGGGHEGNPSCPVSSPMVIWGPDAAEDQFLYTRVTFTLTPEPAEPG